MIVDIIIAFVSAFSDVLGKSLGRYRYFLILIGSYLVGFCVGFVLSIYFYFQLGRFNWGGLIFSTVGLGSVLAVGGIFVAFVNRPRSSEAIGVTAERVDTAKPESPSKPAYRFNSSDLGATNEAPITLVVKPSDIESDPTYKQLTNGEVPVIFVARPKVPKTEE